MSTSVRRLEVARRATVRVCDRAGTHFGQGLLLDLDGEGPVVLTCHHVAAQLSPAELCVALPQADGTLGAPVPAAYDAVRSHPAHDAVVVRVEGARLPEIPLLHEVNADAYRGTLPEKVVCLGHFKSDSFDGWLSSPTRLEVPVTLAGAWPDTPGRYVIPWAFRIREPSDARPGISGSVVVYEDGVVGLAHFSRPAGPDQEREVFVVPISTWAEGWPALERLIEPLVDGRLRSVAIVRRAAALRIPDDVPIAAYRSDVHIDRPVTARASAALARLGGVVIIGRPKSGKTRLAWQLLQERPEAMVVIPREPLPTPAFESSTFTGKEVVLFFDDLHRSAMTSDPMAWRRRFEEASGTRCLVVCTSRDGEDWKNVERSGAARLIDNLGRDALVFASQSGGEGADLPHDEGLKLAEALGLSRQEFDRRFDGTPGSLTLDVEDMGKRYARLRDEQRGGIAMSRLVDAAKLVYEASQPRLHGPIVRAAAERIRGDGRLSAEMWETLQRRTADEGFGIFQSDTGDFQTYKPYLESCVAYTPSVAEIESLTPLLIEAKDYDGLGYLGQALFMRHRSHSAAEQALRAAMEGGNESAATILSWLLADIPGRAADTEAMHRRLLEDGEAGAYVNYGGFLAKQPGREADAENAFREAVKRAEGTNLAPLASWSLGNLLQWVPGREREAEQAFVVARDGGIFLAHLSLAKLLARDPARLAEAEQVARGAFAAIDHQSESIQEEPGKGPAIDPQTFLDSMRGDVFDCLGEILAGQTGREAEAEKAFESAIAAGHDYARRHLALFLTNKPGREADAERVFREAVAIGDSEAGGYLGQILLRRPGGEKEAERLFRDAIAHKLERANFYLGISLAQQEGRSPEAEDAFRKAIAIGVAEANETLGDLLAGQPGREREAEELYKSAIASGVGTANFRLGELLLRQPDRVSEAEGLYREAARLGDPRGAYRLGSSLAHRATSSEPEVAGEAEAHLRVALDAGIENAAIDLGVLLALQSSRQSEGIELLERAREGGIDGAEEMLRLLREGEGTED